MKKGILIVILIVFFIGLIICTIYMVDRNRMKNNQPVIFNTSEDRDREPEIEEKGNDRIALEDLPEKYSFEDAVTDKCVISVHGMEIYNKDELDKFIENVNRNEPDFIRCINYTEEGDMIITDVEFEEDNRFKVALDTTRDNWMDSENRGYIYYKFSKLNIEEDDERIRICLKDSVEDELEEIYITGYNKDAKIINNSESANKDGNE